MQLGSDNEIMKRPFQDKSQLISYFVPQRNKFLCEITFREQHVRPLKKVEAKNQKKRRLKYSSTNSQKYESSSFSV